MNKKLIGKLVALVICGAAVSEFASCSKVYTDNSVQATV